MKDKPGKRDALDSADFELENRISYLLELKLSFSKTNCALIKTLGKTKEQEVEKESLEERSKRIWNKIMNEIKSNKDQVTD